MIDYAWKNITKRAGRSILTVLSIMLMMTLIITITGIVSKQKETMHRHASAGAGKIHVQPRLAGTTYPASGIDLPEDKADALLELIGEYIQQPLSTKMIYFEIEPPAYPNNPPAVMVTGIESGKEEAFTGSIANDIQPVEGVESFTEADAGVLHPAILGQGVVDFYDSDLHVGDTLTVLDTDFTIVGILDQSADQNVNSSILMPLEEAQNLLDKEDAVSALLLTQDRVGYDELIIEGIQTAHPEMNIVDDNTIRRNLDNGIKVFEALINVISLVVVVGATLLIMTVTLITVKERTREIGVLRAIGAQSQTIILSILWETLMLSTMGSLLGGILSGFLMRYVTPENVFSLPHILAYMPLAVVMALLAGLIPAYQISRIVPVESLRYE